MPLYRPAIADAPSGGGGGSTSGAEGGLQAFHNLRHMSLAAVGEKVASSSAPAFASPPQTETVKEMLPKMEIGGASGPTLSTDLSFSGSEIQSAAGGALKGIMDLASKLADPMGFLSFVFQFLQAIFVQGMETMVAGMLPSLNPDFLYSQAAQAALDSKLLKLQM